MAKLYYQGHGSFRLESDGGKVIYLDPYAGDGYDLPADLILVTHAHEDHNCVHLIEKRAEGYTVITQNEAL
ncbi:MAG: MBL fold metallo-hydrolase, partial [Oscillospiraceae bacterium]|nr:MBL fold metallo-hydrolase [Oscillospiraceae bacterium]